MEQNRNVRFIRVNGRVVPIGTKGKSSDWKVTPPRTVRRNVEERAVSGAKTGAKFGAAIGGVSFGLLGLKNYGIGGLIGGAAGGAVVGGINWGVIGAGLGAAFGSRTKQVGGQSVYKPKKKNRTGA